MATEAAHDPVLERLRAALKEMYGDRLERAVLFGSRANGSARSDSDYDVAVFLKTLPDRWTELDRLAKLRVDLLDETDAFVDRSLIPPKPIANARRLCTKSGNTAWSCEPDRLNF